MACNCSGPASLVPYPSGGLPGLRGSEDAERFAADLLREAGALDGLDGVPVVPLYLAPGRRQIPRPGLIGAQYVETLVNPGALEGGIGGLGALICTRSACDVALSRLAQLEAYYSGLVVAGKVDQGAYGPLVNSVGVAIRENASGIGSWIPFASQCCAAEEASQQIAGLMAQMARAGGTAVPTTGPDDGDGFVQKWGPTIAAGVATTLIATLIVRMVATGVLVKR